MLEAIIAWHYPVAAVARRPLGKMLRIHFMQQWYALSDPGIQDALYDRAFNLKGTNAYEKGWFFWGEFHF